MQRRYHLHIPGLIYTGLVVMIGLAAMNGQNNLLFWVFGAMFAGLVLSGIVSGVMMLGVRVRRLDPRHGAVGEPLLIRYAVTNRNRLFPIFNIYLEEQPVRDQRGWSNLMPPSLAWVMHAGPQETVHGEAVFWPTQRGEARFDRLRVWTTFPFGIIKKSVTYSNPHHTLIYPRTYELRRDVLRAVQPPALTGMNVSQRAGAGDDYFGLREYRSGDTARDIAWKRSAMLDELVSIERSRPAPPRLRVLLDLSTNPERLHVGKDEPHTGRDLEERAISLAASLAHTAHLHGFEVGLTVLGMDVPQQPIRRGHWHLHRLLSSLAALDLNQPRESNVRLPQVEVEPAGHVVIAPDRVNPDLGRVGALHLSSRQLDHLIVRPIGWDPAAGVPTAPTEPALLAEEDRRAAGRKERAA